MNWRSPLLIILSALFYFSAYSVHAQDSTSPQSSTRPSSTAQSCHGTLTTVKDTPVRQMGLFEKSLEYKAGKTIRKVDRIVGSNALVSWKNANGSISSGWVNKSNFTSSEFEAVKATCTDNRHLYPTRGDANAFRTALKSPKGISQNIKSNGIQTEYIKMKAFYRSNNRRERYAVINKLNSNRRKFTSYVIDMKTGKVVDTFDSLVGYNGMGCGKGQTQPGIFKISTMTGTGGSRKSHWGNRWRYQGIQHIGGNPSSYKGRKCRKDMEIVAHSNKNMKGSSSRGGRYSAGCFVTSPEKFSQWTQGQAGNMLIYNVP